MQFRRVIGSNMKSFLLSCLYRQTKISILTIVILGSVIFYFINNIHFRRLFHPPDLVLQQPNISIAIRKNYYPEVKIDRSGVNYTDPRIRVSNQQKLSLLRKFLNISKLHGIEVFLIDPKILNSIDKNVIAITGDRTCHFLCHPTNLITFGIFYDAISTANQREKYLTELNKHLLKWIVTNVDKSSMNYLNTNETILPGHIFLYHDILIHLVVFHTRGDAPFLWADKIHFQSVKKPHFVNLYLLNYGKFPIAFDYFNKSVYIVDGIQLLYPSNINKFLNHLQYSHFLECNYSYAETFNKKYPLKDPKASEDFIEAGKQILALAKKNLDTVDVSFQLHGGTLLSWYRQCRLDYNMKDIDIEILFKYYTEEIFPALDKNGLHKLYHFGKVNDSLEFSFNSNGVKLDIFFLYESSEYAWVGGVETDNLQKLKFVFPKYTPCMTEFHGVLVGVPCDPVSSLQTSFGDNFMVPTYEYSWSSSPKNIFKNGAWKESEREKVIQAFQ